MYDRANPRSASNATLTQNHDLNTRTTISSSSTALPFADGFPTNDTLDPSSSTNVNFPRENPRFKKVNNKYRQEVWSAHKIGLDTHWNSPEKMELFWNWLKAMVGAGIMAVWPKRCTQGKGLPGRGKFSSVTVGGEVSLRLSFARCG